MSTLTAGKVAPPFELAGTNGKKYSLESHLAQGPVLAAFFKVSCPTCQFTFPYVERIYQQLRAAGVTGVEVWGISQDKTRDTQSFSKEFGVTFPLLIDEEPYETSREYGLKYVPTLFLIAPDGHVEISTDGFTKADLVKIYRSLAERYSVKPTLLFQPSEKVPEFKPG